MLRSTFSLLMLGAVVTACADAPTPTSPLAATSSAAFKRGSYSGHGSPNSSKAALVRCERRPTYTGSAEIGPKGGTLLVGRSRVIVPPGALNKKVLITATMPEGEFITIRFEFQPHGLVFKKPAGLVLDAAGCNIPEWSSPDIVYLSDDGEILERIQSFYSNHWHVVAAPIWHFSGYAVAW